MEVVRTELLGRAASGSNHLTLIPSSNGNNNSANGAKVVAPRDPSWIQSAAAFRVTLGSWGPLLGTQLLSLLDGGKKKKGKKGGGRGDDHDGTASWVRDARRALELLCDCMEGLQKQLGVEASKDLAVDSVFKFLSLTSTTIPAADTAVGAGEGELSVERKDLLGQVLASHKLSCERIRDGLNAKVAPLRQALLNS